jgi:predicted RNA-binding Zn-ribbon protein involved in translation (DUF1610 family)
MSSRICLGCGYDGPEIQRRGEGAVYLCPCCGEDLYARRPMSYAEMEGFVGARPAAASCVTGFDRAMSLTEDRRVAPTFWARLLEWVRLMTRAKRPSTLQPR